MLIGKIILRYYSFLIWQKFIQEHQKRGLFSGLYHHHFFLNYGEDHKIHVSFLVTLERTLNFHQREFNF